MKSKPKQKKETQVCRHLSLDIRWRDSDGTLTKVMCKMCGYIAYDLTSIKGWMLRDKKTKETIDVAVFDFGEDYANSEEESEEEIVPIEIRVVEKHGK